MKTAIDDLSESRAAMTAAEHVLNAAFALRNPGERISFLQDHYFQRSAYDRDSLAAVMIVRLATLSAPELTHGRNR